MNSRTPPTLTNDQAFLIQTIASVTHVRSEGAKPFAWSWIAETYEPHERAAKTVVFGELLTAGIITRLTPVARDGRIYYRYYDAGGRLLEQADTPYWIGPAALDAWDVWFRYRGYEVEGAEAMFG